MRRCVALLAKTRKVLFALLFASSFAVANPIDDLIFYGGPFGDDVTLTAPLGALQVIGSRTPDIPGTVGTLFDLIVPHGRTTTFDAFDISFYHGQGGAFSYAINVGPYTQIVSFVPGHGISYDDGFVDALLGPGTYEVSATQDALLAFNFFTTPGEGIVHVPEPGTLSLLVGGLIVFALRRRKSAVA